MSDSIPLNPGTGGVNLAADEISAIHHQRVKVQFGVDGAATDVSAGDPMPVEIAASSASIADVDAMSNALIVIDSAHHEIHGGASFFSGTFDTSMTTSDTMVLAFKTPTVSPSSEKRIHMLVQWSCKASGHLSIIEGPTWDTGSGSQHPIYNRFRGHATTSVILEDTTSSFVANDAMVLNPTTLAGGTTIWSEYGWADKGIGSSGVALDEGILAVDTTYAFVLTADATSNAGLIALKWYEHTDVA